MLQYAPSPRVNYNCAQCVCCRGHQRQPQAGDEYTANYGKKKKKKKILCLIDMSLSANAIAIIFQQR